MATRQNIHLSKDQRRWDPDTHGPWVTKTDVVEFERCAYRVFLAHQQNRPYLDYRTKSAQQLLSLGVETERSVAANLGLTETSDLDAARFEGGLIRVPIQFFNHDLGITGLLDGIMFENDVLVPVEVKAHNRLRRSDRLELAFYWRLLLPLQRAADFLDDCKGYIILGSHDRLQEVPLSNKDLNRADRLITEVRKAKVDGSTLVRVPECDNCTLKQDHIAQLMSDQDVSIIFNVGPSRRQELHNLGIDSITDLGAADLADLHDRWSSIGSSHTVPSRQQLRDMQIHAHAWLTDEPQIINAAEIPPPDEAIILDLEYCTWPDRFIFLVGCLVVQEGYIVDLKQEFAENADDELRILRAMQDILDEHPRSPIVTWSGLTADFPEIDHAWQKHGLSDDTLEVFRERHIDLYQRAMRGIRVPTIGLGLKDLSKYFKFPRKVKDVDSGFAALMMYMDYLRNGDGNLRSKLMRYNQDDLNGTFFVWEKLWRIVNP